MYLSSGPRRISEISSYTLKVVLRVDKIMQSPFWSLFLILTVDPNITVFNKQPKKGCMFLIGLMFWVKFIIVTGTNNREVIGMIGSVVRYCSKNFISSIYIV